MKILAIDCHYVEKEFAASFLMTSKGRGLFVECNTTHAIPFLKKAAKDEGLDVNDVEGLIITHVHLDHAGGAGAFLQTFPNAKVYAHPRAARHLVDPSKLIASATAVYGEATLKKWYGEILPCDPARVVVLEDGDAVNFAGLKLETKHLRGHANHHLVVIEPSTQTLFSGDTFGVAYPALTHHSHEVIVASTSPTDFDGEAALAAIDWITQKDPAQIALTHFGLVPHAQIAFYAQILRDQLHYALELSSQIIMQHLEVDAVAERLQNFLVHYFESRQVKLEPKDLRLLSVDIKVNAQGLHFAAHKNREGSFKQ